MIRWVFALILLPLSRSLVSGATVVVNDTSNVYHDPGCATTGVGQCTLVDAIAFANVHAGADSINFDLPGVGIRTIIPTMPLPPLSDDAGATIDGFSQPGATPNSLTAGNDAVWKVRISGSASNPQGAGIDLRSSNNVVRGLIVQAWFDGIQVSGGAHNQVSGNLLGSAAPDDTANGNGVSLRFGATDNRIGGTAPADRNVINGNGAGIYLTDPGTSDNSIQGNIVGPSAVGSPVRNYRGIQLYEPTVDPGPSFNLIGGTDPGAGNVISGNETNGIDLLGPVSNNRIEGNLIGTTPDGTAAVGNLWAGVMLFAAPQQNVIGGTAPGAGNVISGNGIGIDIQTGGTDGNRIEGNRIGTNPQGTAAIPNGGGIGITFSARGNVIGGETPAARNLISGNLGSAIGIAESANDNVIVGNFIGTDASGNGRIGNGQDVFTAYYALQIFGSSRNRVEANRIAHNGNPWAGGGGIIVGEGRNAGDTVGNAVLANSIHDNYGLGIDLYEPGIPYRANPNDVGDGDSGPNGLQNYPVITDVLYFAGGTSVNGTLNSEPSSPYTIQFFSSPRCDDSGHGEGRTFIGSGVVSTDSSGSVAFSILLPPTAPGGRITATATSSAGSTSEFSECFPQATAFYVVTPCRVADTRDANGPWGGPALTANSFRNFQIAGKCDIPETAQAVAFNLTSTGATAGGHLTIFPVGRRLPLASTLNFGASTRANNAIIPLGTDGEVGVWCAQPFGGTTHFVIDVNGYFE